MISERVKKYCKDDISLIENYEQAINDKTQIWHCHHRGEILACGRYTPNDLKKFGLYWGRPASELIFLTKSEHKSLHMRGTSYFKGRKLTEDAKNKIRLSNIGKKHSYETRIKMSIKRKGVKKTDSFKQKISKSQTGKIWITNGIINHRVSPDYNIPDGWTRGFTKK